MSEDKNQQKKLKLKTVKKNYSKCKENLIFQLYMDSEYVHEKYGSDGLQEFYKYRSERGQELKMNRFFKMMEGLINRLPKGLKIKEGIKLFMGEVEFIEDLDNIKLLENTSEKGIYEIINCSIRKEFNKLAKKANKTELIDKCCLRCLESIPMAESFGVSYNIKLTEKGCLNILF